MSREVPAPIALTSPLNGVQRVIAIVGCQRSGTTLTGQILGAHPNAVLVDETEGLYRWFHAAVSASPDASARAQEMLDRASAKYRDADGRFHLAGGRVALAPRATTLVLKAPNLTYDDEQLARLEVPVTIVYPVRDPRGVVASMMRLGHIDFVGNQRRLIGERPATAARYGRELRVLGDETPPWVRLATVWRIKSGRALDFRRRSHTVTQFRYEDLVREPQAVTSRVVAACGLSESDAVSRFHAIFTGHGPGGTDRTRAIDGLSLSKWSEELDRTQQREILEAAAPLAASFGYE